jgi:hypothetical protein
MLCLLHACTPPLPPLFLPVSIDLRAFSMPPDHSRLVSAFNVFYNSTNEADQTYQRRLKGYQATSADYSSPTNECLELLLLDINSVAIH